MPVLIGKIICCVKFYPPPPPMVFKSDDEINISRNKKKLNDITFLGFAYDLSES